MSMTPEDTPRMAERTDLQAQIEYERDAFDLVSRQAQATTLGLTRDVADLQTALSAAYAALSTAEATITTLRAERDAAQAGDAKWKASGDVMEAEKVRALQDAINLQQENKTLREALDNSDMEVELLEAYVEDLRTICEQANIDPDAARVALSSSPRQQEPQP